MGKLLIVLSAVICLCNAIEKPSNDLLPPVDTPLPANPSPVSSIQGKPPFPGFGTTTTTTRRPPNRQISPTISPPNQQTKTNFSPITIKPKITTKPSQPQQQQGAYNPQQQGAYNQQSQYNKQTTRRPQQPFQTTTRRPITTTTRPPASTTNRYQQPQTVYTTKKTYQITPKPQQSAYKAQTQQNLGKYQAQQNSGQYQPENSGKYQPENGQNSGKYQPQQQKTQSNVNAFAQKSVTIAQATTKNPPLQQFQSSAFNQQTKQKQPTAPFTAHHQIQSTLHSQPKKTLPFQSFQSTKKPYQNVQFTNAAYNRAYAAPTVSANIKVPEIIPLPPRLSRATALQSEIAAKPQTVFKPTTTVRTTTSSQASGNARSFNVVNDVKSNGIYRYSYNTDNGISAQEQGQRLSLTGGAPGLVSQQVQGSYSYVSPEGTVISVRYVADESGFHPVGDHIPNPPPIPQAIARAIRFIESKQQ